MATLTLPRGLCPVRFELVRVSMGFGSRSPVTGAAQVRATIGWFWRAHMEFNPMRHDKAAAIEAWLASFGIGDVLQMGHPIRPVPRGTMRGSPTVSGAHAAGATTVSINATSGSTLRAGDVLGIGGRLYQVTADMTHGVGATNVSIAGGLLATVSGGSAVSWNSPTTTWRRLAPTGLAYRPRFAEGWSIDLEEHWT